MKWKTDIFFNACLRLCVHRSTPCRGPDHRGERFSCGRDGAWTSYPSCGGSLVHQIKCALAVVYCLHPTLVLFMLHFVFLQPISKLGRMAPLCLKSFPSQKGRSTTRPWWVFYHSSIIIASVHIKNIHPYYVCFSLLAIRTGHDWLQPSAGPGHPLRRCRHELQKRWHPGNCGPDRCPLVAGKETTQQHSMCWPHPLHQPPQTVRYVFFKHALPILDCM